MNRETVKERVGSVVAAVVRQAVRNAGAKGIVIMDDGTPEARLTIEWCTLAVGAEDVVAIAPPPPAAVESIMAALGVGEASDSVAIEEAHRFQVRLVAASRGALLAHPANKTALLLGTAMPPEPLLPLGDLYASQIREIMGEWSAPDEVCRLADEAGGIDALDAALSEWLEGRRSLDDALRQLPAASDAVRRALKAGRFWRRRVGLVPKLGFRTLGIDLFG